MVAQGRYLAYMVKPKTSSVYEIDIFDNMMRETKHMTTGTPRQNEVGPILVGGREVDRLYPGTSQGNRLQYLSR